MKRFVRIFLLIMFVCTAAWAQRTPVPPASAAMLNIANKLVVAINAQDAASLTGMMATDAVYLDEDGHALRVPYWIRALTTGTPAKKIEISEIHGQESGAAGWVSFNYVLTETLQGAPKAVRGTASLIVQKPDLSADWKILLIHGALEQTVRGITQ